MRFRYLRPLHGWRAFAGDVGVIVLGVLLALGAQQAVEGVEMRRDMKAFRQTIDREIGLNLFVYDLRARQSVCVKKHLDELRSWLATARSGQATSMRVRLPIALSPYRSAWQNRNPAVFNNLPDTIRAKYAEFYDELENNSSTISAEVKGWQSLAGFAEPGPISLQDRRQIRTTLSEASVNAGDIVENIELSRKLASDLKVRKIAPDGLPLKQLERGQGAASECRAEVQPAADRHLPVRIRV